MFYKSSINHMKEVTLFQEKLDREIIIDLECKDVKPELKSPSTTIFKTENQSYPLIVKIKKQVENNYRDEKIPEILIKKEVDYSSNCQLQENSQLDLDKSEKDKIFGKSNLSRKTYKEEA
ncbi:uncharacterized protein LOC106660193 [Trichogramma pretiosum]|uniref:uncharacterized protein LOC106660193 n=1 Tax=Trichogramma pretiosum TaxID=7493 RepID=UPI0006C9D470|nr:uncharacterized protein LOC106660193 [Trichogramma pretiosum]